MNYEAFIASKRRRAGQIGRDCEPGECHPMLHDWQAEAVAWAVRTGRAAIFWDCGLGKTFAQHGRKFVGCELKPSYWATAVENLRTAEGQLTLA